MLPIVTLPGPVTGPDAVLRFVLARFAAEGPHVVLLVRGSASEACVLVDINGSRGVAALRRVAAGLDGGLLLLDVLVVRTGRWWSLCCTDRLCCPERGHPLTETSVIGGSSP